MLRIVSMLSHVALQPHTRVQSPRGPLLAHTPSMGEEKQPYQPLTFLGFVWRDVLGSEALIQDVEHLSPEIDEEQWKGAERHGWDKGQARHRCQWPMETRRSGLLFP